MTTNDKKAIALGRFRVIEGGPPAASPTSPPKRAMWQKKPRLGDATWQESDSPPAVKDRLRRAILALPVEGTGITVEQILDEYDERCDEETEAALCRVLYLKDQLGKLGFMIHLANPDLELARCCYMRLTQPEQLLAAYPELEALNAGNERFLMIG
ncbi:hypothetical protein [Roseateles sp.]|uniref:hypothetical protein n=1 Tax=Roseateles sp. TaxID=1971397 RepID=UPI0031D114AC